MNRLLTLTSGGLFAAMSILPIGAFAQTGATTQDSKTPATMSAPTGKSDVKTTAPVTAQAETPKAGTTDTKPMTMSKHDDKHGAKTVEASKPVTHSSVQPKVTDQTKS